MPTTTISHDSIKVEMQNRWGTHAKTHGDKWSIPKEDRFALGEYERAMHVLLTWKNEGEKGNPIRTLRSYGVMEAIIVEIVSDWCDMTISTDDLAEVKVEKRADKYDTFIDWTKDKVFEQYTTDALVEQAGFSYPTVLKFLQESPHFRKVKKGLWEIRDPKADREAEKD
jgi:hypothetical protein